MCLFPNSFATARIFYWAKILRDHPPWWFYTKEIQIRLTICRKTCSSMKWSSGYSHAGLNANNDHYNFRVAQPLFTYYVEVFSSHNLQYLDPLGKIDSQYLKKYPFFLLKPIFTQEFSSVHPYGLCTIPKKLGQWLFLH